MDLWREPSTFYWKVELKAEVFKVACLFLFSKTGYGLGKIFTFVN